MVGLKCLGCDSHPPYMGLFAPSVFQPPFKYRIMNNLQYVDFRVPQSLEEVAIYIGINHNLLSKVISSNTRKEFYLKHRIPKRSKHRIQDYIIKLEQLVSSSSFRIVWEVEDPYLADAHKTFARRFGLFLSYITGASFPHDAAYGYVKNRNILDNAKNHCGSPLLLRADIKDFFPSISSSRLTEIFTDLGINKDVAIILAKFATIDDRLALGLNASPMLANLVCLDLDKKIESLSNSHNCKYTRYADDIAISGKINLPSKGDLEAILQEEGFQLNHKKFRLTKLGQAHYVTGLSVSDINRPHIPREIKHRLRQELYYCNKFGICRHLAKQGERHQRGINRLDGTVRYVASIEKDIAGNLKEKWRLLLNKEGVYPSYDPIEDLPIRNISFFVDESEITIGEKSILALAFVRIEDTETITNSTNIILRNHIVDPFSGGRKKPLNKKGLHFTDAHNELRTAYIKELSSSSFKGYLAYGELESPDKYPELYLYLARKLLVDRLFSSDGAKIEFIFEQNPKVQFPIIQNLVTDTYESLKKTNNRRPIEAPKVILGKKLEHPCLSVPDFLLGVFADYAAYIPQKDRIGIEQHNFERLRDKYRLILDANKGTFFSRKMAFYPWGKEIYPLHT